jgi:protein involved in polysaccharide export with SLBB domain
MLRSIFRRNLFWLVAAAAICSLSGCYAPLMSHAVPASTLPDTFRIPFRTGGQPLNLSTLTLTPPRDYLLGPEDVLEVRVPGLYAQAEIQPLRVLVMSDGTVHLPLIGSVPVQGANLVEAQRAISEAYAQGFIVEPRVSVVLAQKSTSSVLVLGQVKQPGTYPLPKYENDVGHAIGAAFGLTEEAGDYIEVHRQLRYRQPVSPPAQQPYNGRLQPLATAGPPFDRLPRADGWPAQFASQGVTLGEPLPAPGVQVLESSAPQILRIPLRGMNHATLNPQDIILGPGDVVVVPDRRHEVFFVVGALSTTNTVRFTVGNRERELGVGFVLPRDREIDVVTAVAMAGYIDPISSPTTVTVHRIGPDGHPVLILVDLIKARYDRRETILVQPGDIIYLNPDHEWWWRRFIDRTLIDAFRIPYTRLWR